MVYPLSEWERLPPSGGVDANSRTWRLVAVTVGLGVVVSACSPVSPFAARLIGGAVEILEPSGCPGRTVEIKLVGPGGDLEDRPLVWHVAAGSEEGVDLDTFTVGLEPEGFETVVSLDAPLDPDVQYVGWTNVVGAGPNIGRLDEESRNFSFQPSELTGDWVETYTGDPVDDAESFDPPC